MWWDEDGDGVNDCEFHVSVDLTVESGLLEEGEMLCAPNPVGDDGLVCWCELPDDTETAWFKLFDIDGTLLAKQELVPGASTFPPVGRWNPQDDLGRPLANGLYLYVVDVLHTDGSLTRSKIYKLVVER